jgi:hypothetical protein
MLAADFTESTFITRKLKVASLHEGHSKEQIVGHSVNALKNLVWNAVFSTCGLTSFKY